MMNRLLTIVILFSSSLFLQAGEEIKEGRVKNEAGKEELTSKKGAGAAKKSVTPPSRKIKIFSHTASITLPAILLFLFTYFLNEDPTEGFFENKYVNMVVCSILFSVVGFYFYLYLEAFLAKKMASRFFSGLISFLLSFFVMEVLLCLYSGSFPEKPIHFLEISIAGVISSLNCSLLSWFIYKGINRFLL